MRKDDNTPLNCFLIGTILYFSVFQGVLAFALRFVLQSLSFSVILFGALDFTDTLLFIQLIWDRALGLPLERPKSVTMELLENHCKKAPAN
jgi:hypothetical protein